ncbi:MAG: response regulator [Chloroflexota bacterium]
MSTEHKTILVVEDDATLAEAVKYNLEKEGYRVVVARDGERGLELARSGDPDLIVLDILLPKLDGLEVCRILRKETSVPILMLTAKAEEVDRVVGLEMGADDYLTKPFSLREFLARVKAMLRRAYMGVPAGTGGGDVPSSPVIRAGDLELDPDRHEVRVRNERVGLSPKEFELLTFLAKNRQRAFGREYLLERVWGYDYAGDSRTVDVHVHWLRQKIENDPAHPEHVVTVRGVGYKFEG